MDEVEAEVDVTTVPLVLIEESAVGDAPIEKVSLGDVAAERE